VPSYQYGSVPPHPDRYAIRPLPRPEEVADVVAFLCSREASAIAGSPVRADGGVVMAIT
jgi:NAD(P)-dependent dehydrogenase (short-subunit alcohol dehydrogenase family)